MRSLCSNNWTFKYATDSLFVTAAADLSVKDSGEKKRPSFGERAAELSQQDHQTEEQHRSNNCETAGLWWCYLSCFPQEDGRYVQYKLDPWMYLEAILYIIEAILHIIVLRPSARSSLCLV